MANKISTKLQVTTLNGSKSVTKSLTFANSEKDNATLADSARMINSLSSNTLKSIVRVDRQNITDAEMYTGFTYSLTNPIFGIGGFGENALQNSIVQHINAGAKSVTGITVYEEDDSQLVVHTIKEADDSEFDVRIDKNVALLEIMALDENRNGTVVRYTYEDVMNMWNMTSAERINFVVNKFNTVIAEKNCAVRMVWTPETNTIKLININPAGGEKKRKIDFDVEGYDHLKTFYDQYHDNKPEGFSRIKKSSDSEKYYCTVTVEEP